MGRRIVLLSNTYPFGGEIFLQNELKWIPNDQSVNLYPIFAADRAAQAVQLNSNIDVRRFDSVWSVKERLNAGWNSLKMLFKTKEYAAALNKAKSLRNLIKAFKFAYISELRFSRILRQQRADGGKENEYIFYSYWLYEAAYIAARLKKSFPSSRFVSRCHGFDLYEIRHPNGYLPFRNFIMESADAVFPISEDGREYISQKYNGKWDGKVHTMRLGTDDWGVNPANACRIPTLVSCSNMVDVKRIDKIIDALKTADKEIRWYHFGDGPLREQLEQKAQELPPNVEYQFMGLVNNEELMRFYQTNHVDAFINVSSSEGVPVSIMEGLSFSIPVIATDVGGTHEIVLDGINGYLLPVDFTNEMFCTVISKVIDPQNRDELRKQARRVWENTCNAGVNFPAFYRTITQ